MEKIYEKLDMHSAIALKTIQYANIQGFSRAGSVTKFENIIAGIGGSIQPQGCWSKWYNQFGAICDSKSIPRGGVAIFAYRNRSTSAF